MGEPSDVSAGFCRAGNKAGADWVDHLCKDDRNGACLLPHGRERRIGCHQDNVRLPCNQLLRLALHELSIALGPAFIKLDVPSIGPAQCLQRLPEGRDPRLSFGVPRNPNQHSDPARLTQLLRTRRKRPCRRAAEHADELAAPDHSITSSASASSLSGTVRPSIILAVWWLITSSILDTCITGKSAGRAPLRMQTVGAMQVSTC